MSAIAVKDLEMTPDIGSKKAFRYLRAATGDGKRVASAWIGYWGTVCHLVARGLDINVENTRVVTGMRETGAYTALHELWKLGLLCRYKTGSTFTYFINNAENRAFCEQQSQKKAKVKMVKMPEDEANELLELRNKMQGMTPQQIETLVSLGRSIQNAKVSHGITVTNNQTPVYS